MFPAFHRSTLSLVDGTRIQFNDPPAMGSSTTATKKTSARTKIKAVRNKSQKNLNEPRGKRDRIKSEDSFERKPGDRHWGNHFRVSKEKPRGETRYNGVVYAIVVYHYLRPINRVYAKAVDLPVDHGRTFIVSGEKRSPLSGRWNSARKKQREGAMERGEKESHGTEGRKKKATAQEFVGVQLPTGDTIGVSS